MAQALYVGFLLSGLVDPDTGLPLNLGTIEFYENDTVTFKNIWYDSNKNALAPNPFTLSDVGDANIYADGTYNIVVKNASGTIIHAWDGIQFTPAGPNISGVITAANFGSAMDDVTIAAAIASAGGNDATVYLTPGNWMINNNLTIPSNINLRYEMGAYTTVAFGATLTFNSSVIQAPNYNIFRGLGTVTLNPKINFIPTIWLQGGATTDTNMTGILNLNGELKVDNLDLNGNTLSSITGDLNIIPFSGQSAIIDSHWGFKANILTGLTNNDTIIAAFTGKNITIEGVTFDGGIVAGISSITATTFNGDLIGNVTGNVTGNITGNVTGNLTGLVLTASQPNITSLGTLSSLTISGDLTVDTNTLYVDSSNNKVGIGTLTPEELLHVNINSNSDNIMARFSNVDANISEHRTSIALGAGIFGIDSFEALISASTNRGADKHANLIFTPRDTMGVAFDVLSVMGSTRSVGINTISPLTNFHVVTSDTDLIPRFDAAGIGQCQIHLMGGTLGTVGNQSIALFGGAGSTARWTFGTDENDGQKFKICQASDIGTNDRFTLTPSGAASFLSTLDVTGTVTFLNTLNLTGAATFSSTLVVNNGIDSGNNGTFVKKKVIIAGTVWNMDANPSFNVAHGLSVATILTYFVRIIPASGVASFPIEYTNSGTNVGSISVDSTNFNLLRTTGGFFDDSTFNASQVMITVEYV